MRHKEVLNRDDKDISTVYTFIGKEDPKPITKRVPNAFMKTEKGTTKQDLNSNSGRQKREC